ncbi:unnamed protein product, partial [Clonostachys byssicola]
MRKNDQASEEQETKESSISSYYEAQDKEPLLSTQTSSPDHSHSQRGASAISPGGLVSTTEAISSHDLQLRPLNDAFPINQGRLQSQTPRTTAFAADATIIDQQPAADPVIGHMGRLVSNDEQIAMFAGSSTGAHFISQAEQQVQMQKMHADAFPSCTYSMHLHSLWDASVRRSPSQVTRDIISRLPAQALEIVAATIDRWTPLYPIFHKPSTMEICRQVISHPHTKNVIIVYQTLILLAVGSLGNQGTCMRHHYHYLCASEPYYDMSALILGHILDRPCLQTLQGLEMTQIYLQLTSRYTHASHISGVATRLAQNLGLHRHSNRFKFDPLETELRRRVWWCQYTLDVMSSAHHGIPRLIRDQDVDTDLPTRVDHDLLSRSHVSFPLPGEATQVDSAMLLFKLARIIGDTLEKLYSTTRRRGGVAKITRLQAELDAWEHSLPSESDAEMADPGTGDPKNDTQAPAISSFCLAFLRATLCVATAHVHRPALAFTTVNPQFQLSLKACTRAASNLIQIISNTFQSFDAQLGFDQANHPTNKHVEPLVIILLYPIGAHMVWQAGLTILFAHWNGYTVPDLSVNDENTVKQCSEVLRKLGGFADDAGGNLKQCADVLDLLCQKTFTGAEVANLTTEQLQWNVWDWPMASALELANTLDAIPFDLEFSTWDSQLNDPR